MSHDAEARGDTRIFEVSSFLLHIVNRQKGLLGGIATRTAAPGSFGWFRNSTFLALASGHTGLSLARQVSCKGVDPGQ
jgi:hypothetical protein